MLIYFVMKSCWIFIFLLYYVLSFARGYLFTKFPADRERSTSKNEKHSERIKYVAYFLGLETIVLSIFNCE